MANYRHLSTAEEPETDIIVIGGGGTGLAAAAAAAEAGMRVVVLEKSHSPGGTSVFPDGLLAAESPVQRRMGVAALKDEVFGTAMDYAHWKINPRIFRAFIEKSGDTIDWLESKGLRFGAIYSMYPGIDALTFHALERGKRSGPAIVKTLRGQCERLGVRVLTDCPANKILTGQKGEMAGVLATMRGRQTKISTGSVIIATGGYSANKKLLKKYCPEYSENIAFLGAPNTGDGLLMATEIGAATEGLGTLLLHPHYYRGPVRVDAIAQEPYTVWVNRKAERFCDEALTFRATECGNAVNRQPEKCAYVLFDEGVKKRIEADGFLRGGVHGVHEVTGTRLSNLRESLEAETAGGGVKIAGSWNDIAKWMGAPPQALQSTISEYNRYCEQGYDGLFNKERRYLLVLDNPPFYGVRCFVSCLDTIGGIKINHHMEVLDKNDNPIPGLYAGGNAAGGWESDTYCMLLPGSAFGFAINSGRIAGENASGYASRKASGRQRGRNQ